ncbi:MAG: glycosyltransferase family 2 protein [Planctomycetota bacterium]
MSQTHQDLYLEPAKPLAEHELPRLSIIILNWNGRHHLDGCFESLGAADYPREKLDVICVDNGSDDGSQAHLKAKHAWVRLIQNPRNLGFAGGCNVGVANADQPDILVFLNNDLRIEPDFFRNLVAPIVRGQVQAAGGLMYAWDGKTVDSAGGGMNFHGFGIQYGLRKPFGPEFERPRWTLFACGGAMAMDAKVYADLGGFDNRFFAYYEDVDLGWRSWVQGYKTCYVPSARCYHHLSSTSRRVPPERLRLLQVRNPMLACLKNYDEANFARVFPTMLALATRRSFLASGLGAVEGDYRIENMLSLPKAGRWQELRAKLRKARARRQPIDRIGAADQFAINDVIGDWNHWMGVRSELQARRKRSDSEILGLFLRPMWCIEGDQAYQNLHHGLADLFGLRELFAQYPTLGEDPA